MWGRISPVVSSLFQRAQASNKFIRSPRCSFTEFASQIKNSDQNIVEVRVPSDADVVVIGGGVAGCSCLYHLAKLGVTNTVLLESHDLTAGTTWHTAGLISSMGRTEMDYVIRDTTVKMLKNLEEETGVDPGWMQVGALYLCSNKVRHFEEGMKDFQRWTTFMRAMGHDCQHISPSELKDMYPILETSDINSAIYFAEGGQVDPGGLCDGLTRWAIKGGAKVVKRCTVKDIKMDETLLGGRRVSEVHTTHGVIKTNAVINATGAWSNNITSMIGVTIPLQSYRHGYVVTEGLEGVVGKPNIRDYYSSAYIKSQGDSLLVGSFEPNPEPIDKLSNDFPFGLYEKNWDVFGPVYEKAMQRIPDLENIGIKSTIVGPESFTPDGNPIVGEDPDVQGFFYCCGFNSKGMQYAGGCGDQLAKWVVRGEPELDLFSVDIRRFHPPLCQNKKWVLERSQEYLSSHYKFSFPHDEPLAGRNQRISPIHKELERAGSVFQERNGWERPAWFHTTPSPVLPYDFYGAYDHTPSHADYPYYNLLAKDYTFDISSTHHAIQKECISCRESAVIFDMTSFGKYYLIGEDAQKAADWIFSSDMLRPAGSTIYTCMLNERGGIEADLTVSVCEGSQSLQWEPTFENRGFYITTGCSTGHYCASHILREARNKGWNLKILNQTEDIAIISVQGPRSREILQQLTHDDLSDSSFPFSTHKTITLGGHHLRAIRLSFVGELGWELHVSRDEALEVYRSVMDAGKSFGITNAGYRAMDSLSCEKGYRHWHSDICPDDTPLEAGLGFTCKLKTNTDFKGRTALERQLSEGISKKLITLTLEDSKQLLWGLEGIVRNGKIVGYVRRAEYAYSLGCAIAFGYVNQSIGSCLNKDFLSKSKWELEVMGNHFSARLHLKSPFDPKNLRVKGIYTDKKSPLNRD